MAVTILDGGIGHLLKQPGVQTRVRGTPLEQSFLTSAYANEDDAGAVLAVHRDYLNAGANVLTANNFAVTVGLRLPAVLSCTLCCFAPIPVPTTVSSSIATQPWSLARAGGEGQLSRLTEARRCTAADFSPWAIHSFWALVLPCCISECDLPAQLAARLARQAAAEAVRHHAGASPVRIAGSLPPVGESYHVAALPELELAQPVYAEVPHLRRMMIDAQVPSRGSCGHLSRRLSSVAD